MLSSSLDPTMLTEAFRHGAQCYAEKFPSPAQLREILDEAKNTRPRLPGRSAFHISCNLLLAAHASARPDQRATSPGSTLVPASGCRRPPVPPAAAEARPERCCHARALRSPRESSRRAARRASGKMRGPSRGRRTGCDPRLVAGGRGDRARHAALPHAVPRQEQPRRGLLGRVRRRPPALLRPAGAAARGAGPILEFGEDQENFAIGFWTGGRRPPLLYAYVVPRAATASSAPRAPGAARWDEALAEFVLPYDELRRSASPEADLLAFFRGRLRGLGRPRWMGPRRARGPVPALPGPAGAGRCRGASAHVRRGGAAGGRRRSRWGRPTAPTTNPTTPKVFSTRSRCRRRGSRSAPSSPPR